MKPWKTLATSHAPGGSLLTLQQRDVEFAIRVDGQTLMSSRSSGSERAMAEAACSGRSPRRILIGGLGMGYTLRAVLDLVGANAEVTVAELSEAVIEWNKGVLAPLASAPLEDPRVRVIPRDVRKVYKSGPFDAILLDVDNGPTGLTRPTNDWLYAWKGLEAAHRALRPNGILAVWSAAPDPGFTRRMERAGFDVEPIEVRSRGAKGGSRHVVWVGVRRSS